MPKRSWKRLNRTYLVQRMIAGSQSGVPEACKWPVTGSTIQVGIRSVSSVMTSLRHLVCGTAFLSLALFSGRAAVAQTPSAPDGVTQGQPTEEKPDPLKRQPNDKERFAQQKALKQELKGVYKKWLDEDVRWIITDQEMAAFKHLSNDEERDSFIEQFWLRRNPNPDSPDNEYRDEHYRRIAYANEHFAAGKPGWKTD